MQQIQGKTVILCCLAVALALAGWAWTYQLLSTQKAAAFWGRSGVRQLVEAEQATAWKLGPDGDLPEAVDRIAGRPVLWEREISDAPGLVHLRHALTQDRNFRWGESPSDLGPAWGLAIQLGEGPEALTILFDREYAYVGQLEPDGQIQYVDSHPMQPTLQKYFKETPWMSDEP